MKKTLLFSVCAALTASLVSCGGPGGKAKTAETADAKTAKKAVPEYTVVDNAQVDLASFPQDKDGYYVIFDGKTLNGWRGYGKDKAPSRWTVEDGAIKFNGSGGGEAQTGEGGDLIFAKKFKNFELEMEWKVSKGGNSGIFYLAQEVTTQKDGKTKYEPIYISCPEYQVLDNTNHPDAKLGVDGNRQSASLYDMIPAVPQNQNPFGEWNKAKIMVYKGTVVHGQNDKNVVEYHLWTPQWTKMLENSKFSSEKWPLAFELLNNCGGENHEGYIGLQDHGDDVWFRNIRQSEESPEEGHRYPALFGAQPDRGFRQEPGRLQTRPETARRHGLHFGRGRQLQGRNALRADSRAIPQGCRGCRYAGDFHALHAQPLRRGAGERRFLEGPRLVGRVHRGAQGRRCGIYRGPLDA